MGRNLDLLLLFLSPARPGGLMMLAHQCAHLVVRQAQQFRGFILSLVAGR